MRYHIKADSRRPLIKSMVLRSSAEKIEGTSHGYGLVERVLGERLSDGVCYENLIRGIANLEFMGQQWSSVVDRVYGD